MTKQSNPVTWFEIYVQDMHKAKAFYEIVLAIQMADLEIPSDMESVNDFQMLAFPWVQGAPNATGALVKAKGVPSGGNSTLVYFTSEDCSIEEGRVENAGGKVIKPKFQIGEHGYCSICMDTDGNVFGLHSMK
jgi:uncharacterized protein